MYFFSTSSNSGYAVPQASPASPKLHFVTAFACDRMIFGYSSKSCDNPAGRATSHIRKRYIKLQPCQRKIRGCHFGYY